MNSKSSLPRSNTGGFSCRQYLPLQGDIEDEPNDCSRRSDSRPGHLPRGEVVRSSARHEARGKEERQRRHRDASTVPSTPAGNAQGSGLAARQTRQSAAKGGQRNAADFTGFIARPSALLDRPQFLERLRTRLGRGRSAQGVFALLFLNLDRFKLFNEAFGRDVGDVLLAAASRRIRLGRCAGDFVAHLGGDEFAVLLVDLAAEPDAASVAQQIATDLAMPYQVEGREIYVTASIGIALNPGDGDDAGTLLRHAESAMYRAKHTDRRIAFFEPTMETSAGERLQLESELRRALDQGEFELHYQPEIEAATGRVVAAEALLRWQHPSRGLIAPDQFISIAEEIGLIGSIGSWVLDTACAQLEAWRESGHDIRMAVNFSVRQLEDLDIVRTVKSALNRFGLQPADLIVEITESMLLPHPSNARNNLCHLKLLGVQIAIDDFGTGYSSLSYLKHLPIDILKIDRSFIADIATSDDDNTVLRGIVSLAHALDLIVIVEGVETRAQYQLLHRMGCDVVQGYLLGKPCALDRFPGLLPATPALCRASASWTIDS